MLIFLCPEAESLDTYNLSLSEYADFAQVIIAIINLILVIFIFYKQLQKSDTVEKKNVRLQWFKELVMQPNLPIFNQFFVDIEELGIVLNSNNQGEDGIIEVSRLLRDHFSKFKLKFHQPLLDIDFKLYMSIKGIIEKLESEINIILLDGNTNLSDPTIFNSKITMKLLKSKTSIISQIINFDG